MSPGAIPLNDSAVAPDEAATIDPRRLARLLRRWWPILVVGTLIAAGVAYGVSKAQPPVYQATVFLQENPGIGTTGGGLDFNEIQAAAAQAASVDTQLLTTAQVAQHAIDVVKPRCAVDPDALLKNTTATVSGSQSSIVALAVRACNPTDASRLANAMATYFVTSDNPQRVLRFKTTLKAVNSQINSLTADLGGVKRQLARYNGAATLTPGQQATSNALAGQEVNYTNRLNGLQTDADSLSLRLLGAGGDVQVAQAAIAPDHPLASRTLVNTLIAAVLAFLALGGIAVLIDVFDTRPRTTTDVATTTGLPLLGTISPAAPGASVLPAIANPASPLADEYRLVRTRIGAAQGAAGGRVLAVAGSAQGSGATTVAANLAAIAARGGLRVILVDASLRRPALHVLFSLSNRAGLSTLLQDGDGDPLPLLQDGPVPGLRVLTDGPASAESIDLLASENLSHALAGLRRAADLIVVDAASADLPDAAAVAARADATILVARLHGADRAALDTAAERLAEGRPAGVVVPLFTAPAVARPAVQDATAAAPSLERPGRSGLRSAK